MRFVLEVSRDTAGRLNGTAAWDDEAVSAGFSGTLELLRLLEDHTEPTDTPA